MHALTRPFFLSLVLFAGGLAGYADEHISFEKDVQPIFAKRCFGCHSPQAERLKGNLDLSTAALALQGGESGASIVPGDADKSPLVQMIEWKIEPAMPPKGKFEQLAQTEIGVIRKWIADGAKSVEAVVPATAEVAPAAPAPLAAPAHAAPISAVAFSPDGSVLARGSLHTVELLKIDAATGAEEKLRTLDGHAEMVRALAFTPDGALLAAAGGQPGRGGEVKIWNVAPGEAVRTIAGHKDNILDVAVSPDGKQLATCSYDKLVKIWSLETGEEVRTLKDHVDAVFSVAYSPDGKVLASGAGDRTVKLWDAETGERLITLSDSTDAVFAVAFSPSGQFIAAGAAEKMIRIWDVAASGVGLRQGGLTSSVLVKSTFAHEGPVLQLSYSTDGKTLYSASEDRHVKAWDAETMAERLVFETQSDWVQALALSADGGRVAVGRYDATSAIYSTADGKRLWPAEAMQVAAEKPASKRGFNVDAVFINATIPPSIGSISPVRQHRGSEFELTVDGKNLGEGQPFFTDNTVKVEVVSSEALPIPEFTYNPARLDAQIFDYAQPYRYKLKVTLAAEAVPGDRFLMFRTPLGLTNAVGLRVLAQPDVGEVEPNDQGSDGTPIAIPSTIIGALNSGEDVDRFKVQAQAGQELVFVVTDTAGNTSLRLRDAQGTVLARSEDFGNTAKPRIGYRFEQAGDYFIEFSDSHFRSGLGYRLHAGAFPYVSHVEPLGVPAGAPQKVKVQGFNIGGLTEMEVDPPDAAAPGQTMALPLPAYEANPVDSAMLAVGQFPESVEGGAQIAAAPAPLLAFPSTVNGRIDAKEGAAEQDVYRFAAKQGQTVVVQTEAAFLGSPLDSVLEILSLDGKVLERAQARCVAKTMLTLTDRDSKSGGLRVEDWSDFRVNDYVMVGSEILRARRLPGYADEDMSVVSYAFPQRMGFFGTTPEFHAVGAPVYKVEIHPVGVAFPPNGMPVFPIYWRNDDAFEEGKPRGDSRLDFEAPADGEYLVRVSAADGVGGASHQYRLTLRPLQPDFDVVVDPYWINADPGVAEPVTVRVRRRDGFNGPVRVKLAELPEGFTATENTIVEGEDDVVLALSAGAGAVSTPTDATFRVVATSTLGGAEVTREARIGAISVSQKQPDLVVQADKETLALAPGGTGSLAVTLARNNGFTSRVPINVLNLPFGVQVMNTGLNGILVREGELARDMELQAEPWVRPGKYTIYVQARIESTSPGRLLFISQPVILEVGAPAPEEKLAAAG